MSKLVVAAIEADVHCDSRGELQMVAPRAICRWYGPSDNPAKLEIGLNAEEWQKFRDLGVAIAKRIAAQVEIV